jgi:hypothetical protein
VLGVGLNKCELFWLFESRSVHIKNMKNYNFYVLFYVGSEIMPLISRVEHRPRVCVSHKPCINGLYSIILPKMHARVLKSGIYTIMCMFCPTMWSFSGRQSTRMSTSKVKLLKYQNQSTHIILQFWCRVVL